jgi:predicted GNAT family N-acyltransferase
MSLTCRPTPRKATATTRFVTPDESAYQSALQLRHRVFYQASGISLHDVPDAQELASLHLVAETCGEVCGYGRLTLRGKTAQVSQMVVAEDRRRQGVGSAVLAALLDATGDDVDDIQLAAQLDAVPFYARLGFPLVGEPQLSARLGIPVQTMRLDRHGLPSGKAFERAR